MKEVKENKLNNIVGGQTDNTNKPSENNRSKEEELSGDIVIEPTDEHIIPPFCKNK